MIAGNKWVKCRTTHARARTFTQELTCVYRSV